MAREGVDDWNKSAWTDVGAAARRSTLNMRSILITTCLLVLAQTAFGQSAPSDVNGEVMTIRISADGVCHFSDTSIPCGEVADYLLSKHLAKNRHVHLVVDRDLKYEIVAAALKSLQNAGFKIGFINSDFLQ
ncbi:MAG: hypothetical protein RB191_00270 [Terriglobia bacterium]|nr:hypothetical protein [Terriglobia bacterium]